MTDTNKSDSDDCTLDSYMFWTHTTTLKTCGYIFAGVTAFVIGWSICKIM